MIQAIIDIGSNSIRLAVYKIEKAHGFTPLLNKKETAGLAGYIKKGVMTTEGIDKACQVLTEFKYFLANFKIHRMAAFATAALRNISNSAAAVAEIEERTGIPIRVLSGTEEAALDFVGATREVALQDGLLIDIGGASTEIVWYENFTIREAISLPIGSLNAARQYVHALLPNKEERKQIKEAVLQELANFPDLQKAKKPTVCGIGGSIRAAGKLNAYLFNIADGQMEIKVPNIKKIIKLLENDQGDDLIPSDTLQILLKTVPDRVETILPGLIILHTLIRFFKAEVICISASGVREGYLRQHIMGEGLLPIEEPGKKNDEVSEKMPVPELLSAADAETPVKTEGEADETA